MVMVTRSFQTILGRATVMTVKELKNLLHSVPDDTLVFVGQMGLRAVSHPRLSVSMVRQDPKDNLYSRSRYIEGETVSVILLDY